MGGDDELSIRHQALMLDYAERVVGRPIHEQGAQVSR